MTTQDARDQATDRPQARKAPLMDWERFFRDYRKPDFIPGYTILNKLGGGVFGDVYKAKKTSIGKFYAIKFLKLQDERLSEQVLRELEAVDHFAQVDHPNLVSIEDRGNVGGIPFIVMGYAGDETLKTILNGNPISDLRSGKLFRQIAQGVRALHEHSIVHFDLKPANIFIRGDVARVGDYGLSKLMSESRGTLSMGRGTPYYMAPEMLRRKGDARSDVYSLGVIYYEMITGDVPFKGDSEWEILKKHETEPVRIPEDTSSEMAAFLRQALDKDPERRFRNAGALLTAFESVVGPGAVTAAAPRPIVPLPTPRSPREMGQAAGRLAARGKVNLDRARKLSVEILEKLRDGSAQAIEGAKEAFERESGGASPRPKVPLVEPEPAVAPRKRGPFRWLFHGLGKLIKAPWVALRYTFTHLLQVAVMLVILAVLGVLVHLGLREAIL